MNNTIYTVGHSTRSIEEFISLLTAFGIELLVDVRRFPGSRKYPQFNQAELEGELQRQGLGYVHLPELGGRRHATNSPLNAGWRNASFRGYADYMQTDEFRAGIERLIQLAQDRQTVIMCAEAVPWRCHRSLIADALLVRGIDVEDIMSEKSAKPHKLTPWAKLEGLSITYPEAGPGVSENSEP